VRGNFQRWNQRRQKKLYYIVLWRLRIWQRQGPSVEIKNANDDGLVAFGMDMYSAIDEQRSDLWCRQNCSGALILKWDADEAQVNKGEVSSMRCFKRDSRCCCCWGPRRCRPPLGLRHLWLGSAELEKNRMEISSRFTLLTAVKGFYNFKSPTSFTRLPAWQVSISYPHVLFK